MIHSVRPSESVSMSKTSIIKSYRFLDNQNNFKACSPSLCSSGSSHSSLWPQIAGVSLIREGKKLPLASSVSSNVLSWMHMSLLTYHSLMGSWKNPFSVLHLLEQSPSSQLMTCFHWALFLPVTEFLLSAKIRTESKRQRFYPSNAHCSR